MDKESTKIVYERICKMEPDYVSKIMGYILLNTEEHDMIRLAYSPDGLIQCVINQAKSDLGIPEMAVPLIFSKPSVPSSVQSRGSAMKVCRYFSQGYCKHGNKCRYFHIVMSGNGNDNGNGNEEQQVLIGGRALEKLEMEIVELLKSRRGFPISIAALPMIYYHNYGKSLQAHGYLTETQRHGNPGFTLTKLLANFNCISVLDRPHGQHSVILAEDAPNYMEFSEHGGRQIYLTFPAQSTFTELDVSNYFSKYGPVEDVRIPCQQSRMYGFVTFVYVDTVKQILSTTSTHFVCGAQVLVKPYKEKSELSDRKNIQKHSDQFLFTSKNTSHLPYLGFSTNKLLAHSSGNAEMEFSSSTEQLHEFVDSWTNHHDDSTQGLNLPDSPFASPIRG